MDFQPLIIKLGKESLPAFLGAFFAFFFLKLSDYLKDILKRKRGNFNALVKIEYFINLHLSDISDNIFAIDNLVNGHLEMVRNKKIGFPINRPFNISLDHNLTVGLVDSELINQVVAYNDSIKKLNVSVSDSNNTMESIINSFLQKQFDKESYLRNLEIILEQFISVKYHLINQREKAIELIGNVKYRYKKALPLIDKLSIALSRNPKPLDKDKMSSYIHQIKLEISQNETFSGHELDAIHSIVQKEIGGFRKALNTLKTYS